MIPISHNLHIGGWHDAQRAEGVHIVTVAFDAPFVGNEQFNLVDGPGNEQSVFDAAVDAVVNKANVGAVLVHCVSGRSRSAAVLCKALSVLAGISIHEAYDKLIAAHDKTRIHPALAQLLFQNP